MAHNRRDHHDWGKNGNENEAAGRATIGKGVMVGACWEFGGSLLDEKSQKRVDTIEGQQAT